MEIHNDPVKSLFYFDDSDLWYDNSVSDRVLADLKWLSNFTNNYPVNNTYVINRPVINREYILLIIVTPSR